MQKTSRAKFYTALVIFSLTGQIAWVVENMYLNVFIYKMFNASAADISLMVAASAVAATLTTVFIGALSDRIGKRRIFIAGGYILWGISIFAFALLKLDIIGAMFPAVASAASLCVTLTIALDCLMTFFGSSANDAAFNAWLTDSTDATNRGAAEGINAMMPLVAILAVFGGFMAFDLKKSSSWTIIFLIIGIAVFIIGIGSLLSNGEKHDNRAPDYDDYSTISDESGLAGLNGDLLIWYPILERSIELSSMGIRVNREALERQLKQSGKEERKELYFHRRLIEGSLPQSIGGGIGQSRLCMVLLHKAHVGETQSSIWPEAMREECKQAGMPLI